MTLWAVTMVRDELDVLPYTLQNLVNQGVEGLIVADNMSTDGTYEWLQDTLPEYPITTRVVRDREKAYYQSEKMTAMYEWASQVGATWVIPFDADEVWYSDDGRSLADYFAEATADCQEARIHNYFPTSKDEVPEPVPFRRILHRDPIPSIMAKTAVRAGVSSLVIEQGNHQAHADWPLEIERSTLVVGHFPWRSPEQFVSKVRNGGEAYAAATDTTKVPLNQGEHWRQHGRILKESGPEAIRNIYFEWYYDPPVELEFHPVPARLY